MDESIYEVERDEYAGVIGQINTKTADIEEYHQNDVTIIKIKNKNGTHFTTRIINNETGEEKYYVFNLPEGEDRLPPKKIRQVKLETKEEVQAFFDALSKLQKGEKND